MAIELEGGTSFGAPSRHTSAKGYSNDCIKYNAANLLHWVVFRITRDMLDNDPVGHLTPMIVLIRSREGWHD